MLPHSYRFARCLDSACWYPCASPQFMKWVGVEALPRCRDGLNLDLLILLHVRQAKPTRAFHLPAKRLRLQVNMWPAFPWGENLDHSWSVRCDYTCWEQGWLLSGKLYYSLLLFLIFTYLAALGLSCSNMRSLLNCPEACGILVPWSGIETASPALQSGFFCFFGCAGSCCFA